MQKKLILIFFLFGIISSYAQNKKSTSGLAKKKTSEQDRFLKKQWWLGFKAGANLSEADPVKRYTILTPTNYSSSLANKRYDSFNAMGSQATVEITFQYKNFLFSTQPTYRQSRFTYSNQFRWTNVDDESQSLVQIYKQEQKLIYADLPLIVKYSFGEHLLKPYLQAGIYYSFLINATQTVSISGVDAASGSQNPYTSQPVIVGAKDLFTNYWSLGFGGGITYQLGNVQLVLDASYRKGMSNIADTQNRFSNDRLSGTGDVQDDIKLNNILVSAGVLFPMRFLNSNYKSLSR